MKRIVLAAFLVLSLLGCATPNMKLSQPATVTITPTADKALIYFIRPMELGYPVNAAVYDGDQFVGFVPFNQKLPYLAKPGKHRFMVISEAADFMDADVRPSKTYYVQVIARPGAWRARFSLQPVPKEDLQNEKMKQSIERAQLIENKPEAYEWEKANRASVEQKKEVFLKKWLEKKREQPLLRPDDTM